MRTTLDADAILYKLINVVAVTSVISGSVYRSIRPDDSELEDVVIKTITLSDGTEQIGQANVNIYVKDIAVTIGGKTQYMPNTARLQAIASKIMPLVKEVEVDDDYDAWVIDTQTFNEPEAKQHFLNIKLRVRLYDLH